MKSYFITTGSLFSLITVAHVLLPIQRGHLHQDQIALLRHPQGIRQRHDAELLAVLTDEADLAGANAVVDPVLVGRSYGRSLLRNGLLLPGYGYGAEHQADVRVATRVLDFPRGCALSIDPVSRRRPQWWGRVAGWGPNRTGPHDLARPSRREPLLEFGCPG